MQLNWVNNSEGRMKKRITKNGPKGKIKNLQQKIRRPKKEITDDRRFDLISATEIIHQQRTDKYATCII